MKLAGQRPLRGRGLKNTTREALYGYAFVSLWILGFVVFTAVPLAQTMFYSLNQVTVAATGITMRFVQWQNYTKALFTDPTFVGLLIEYTLQTLVSLPIIIIFSIIIALFLNQNIRFKGLFRTIFFLPVVITSGPVIQELVAQGATSIPGLDESGGVLEFVAGLPVYLRSPVEYLLTSFILILWFSGVQILVFLSALHKINPSIYEAAAIDGASAWEMFWKITLPNLAGTTLIVAFYTIITLSHFAENPVVAYIYDQTYAVGGGIGYASAMSFLYFFVLILMLVVVYFVLSYRGKKQYG
jgi:oligogalacturonide transport system permease protein